eukprot:10439356-Karenia_brevis.AAC.1
MEEREMRRERIALELQWHEMFDDELQEGDFVPTASNPEGDVETEFISGGKGGPIRVEGGRLVPKGKKGAK